jgi:hypothetical protein
MGYRRLAAMECGTLHQSFLLPECEASGAQGSDRVRSVAFHRSGRRNNLRLRARIFRLLLQEKRLPMHGMPHKDGSRSPEKENDGAQTELAGASLFAPMGTRWPELDSEWACLLPSLQTLGNEEPSQRGPAVRARQPRGVTAKASGFALDLRYEGQEAARVVVHDLPQHLVARALLLQLGYEDG